MFLKQKFLSQTFDSKKFLLPYFYNTILFQLKSNDKTMAFWDNWIQPSFAIWITDLMTNLIEIIIEDWCIFCEFFGNKE